MDCIFCKIANGEISTEKIFENEDVIAFNDLNPKAPVHVLIISKNHISGADEINGKNSGVVAKIFEAAAIIAKEKSLGDGFRIVTNCGNDAGQSIAHLHFHMLAGRNLSWPPG